MAPHQVRALSREALIARAEELGVPRPRTLTHAELADEVIRRSGPADTRRERRGWLGRARDLVASVVERGLSLPDASLFGRPSRRAPSPPPPLPTVTLAEIYAAQGYFAKAVAVLDEVLLREPEHAEARRLRGRYFLELSVDEQTDVGAPPPTIPPPAPAEPEAPEEEVVEEPEPDDAAYDVDDVVALAMDAETAFAYWEVRPLTFARAESRHPGGRLVLRVSSDLGRDGEVEAYQRDVPIDELVGDCFVRGLPGGSEVRLSVGYKHADGFSPFAVAPPLQMPRPMASASDNAWGRPAPAAPAPDNPTVTPAMAARMQRTSPLTWVDFDRSEAGSAEVRRRVVRVEERGGASDLYRVVYEEERAARGGASDLARGGASDLTRLQP